MRRIHFNCFRSSVAALDDDGESWLQIAKWFMTHPRFDQWTPRSHEPSLLALFREESLHH